MSPVSCSTGVWSELVKDGCMSIQLDATAATPELCGSCIENNQQASVKQATSYKLINDAAGRPKLSLPDLPSKWDTLCVTLVRQLSIADQCTMAPWVPVSVFGVQVARGGFLGRTTSECS